jgi:hypothetical protein
MLIPVGMVVFGYYLDLLVKHLPQLDRLVCWSEVDSGYDRSTYHWY